MNRFIKFDARVQWLFYHIFMILFYRNQKVEIVGERIWIILAISDAVLCLRQCKTGKTKVHHVLLNFNQLLHMLEMLSIFIPIDKIHWSGQMYWWKPSSKNWLLPCIKDLIIWWTISKIYTNCLVFTKSESLKYYNIRPTLNMLSNWMIVDATRWILTNSPDLLHSNCTG